MLQEKEQCIFLEEVLLENIRNGEINDEAVTTARQG